MSGWFLAWFTYSQGSSKTLNKQGPSLLVHSGGVLGGSPQVTTAFFKAAAPTELFEISTPGGAYHPLQWVPGSEEQSGHLTFITMHQKSLEKIEDIIWER